MAPIMSSLALLKPLTRRVVEDLLRRQGGGGLSLTGHCRWFNSVQDLFGETSDTGGKEADVMDEDTIERDRQLLYRMMTAGSRAPRVFTPSDLADRPGPLFQTHFYHPVLDARLREIGRDADIDFSVELTPGADGIEVLVRRTFMSGEYSFRIPYADDALPEKGGGSPVHDPAFTFRAVASICAWVELALRDIERWSEANQFRGCGAASYGPGIVGFLCGRRIRVAFDLERWPEMAGRGDEQDPKRRVEWFDLEDRNICDPYERDRGILLLQARINDWMGSLAPSKFDRREFFWQRFVEEGAPKESVE